MLERTYRLMWGGKTPVECQARTKGEARGIFKARIGIPSGQRLRMKVRVRKAGPGLALRARDVERILEAARPMRWR